MDLLMIFSQVCSTFIGFQIYVCKMYARKIAHIGDRKKNGIVSSLLHMKPRSRYEVTLQSVKSYYCPVQISCHRS